jgi:hypothetical protein
VHFGGNVEITHCVERFMFFTGNCFNVEEREEEMGEK